MLKPSYLVGFFALIFHIWRVVRPAAPPSPTMEYNGWRGKAYIDDTDMLEIGNWVAQLNEEQMRQALQYYWVNNEIMYPYGAVVRSMFAVFNETTKDRNFSKPFLNGVEVIIHYILLKSFPVIGRRGGIRGTGQDKVILRAAVPPLIACYKKISPNQNFTTEVFPIMKRRKKRRVLLKARRLYPQNRSRSYGKRSRRAVETGGAMENTLVPEDSDIASTPKTLVPDIVETMVSDMVDEQDVLELDDNSTDKKGLARYTYTLSHGSQQKSKKTNIVLSNEENARMENIGVTIFWLIYELIPPLCLWSPAEITPYKTAFDKILGLVLSMYLYDSADFAEEYERIFNMTLPEFEAEWVKFETLAKSMQKEKKVTLTKPYSDAL